MGASGLAILVFMGRLLLFPQVNDPYRFLERQSVAEWQLVGAGTWPATESRVYTWKAVRSDVLKQAKQELTSAGLKEHPDNPKSESFSYTTKLIECGPCGKNADIVVDFYSGRFNPAYPTSDLTDKDPEWVTVVVSTWLDDDWVTNFRSMFVAYRGY